MSEFVFGISNLNPFNQPKTPKVQILNPKKEAEATPWLTKEGWTPKKMASEAKPHLSTIPAGNLGDPVTPIKNPPSKEDPLTQGSGNNNDEETQPDKGKGIGGDPPDDDPEGGSPRGGPLGGGRPLPR